jgi:hypothetical protein
MPAGPRTVLSPEEAWRLERERAADLAYVLGMLERLSRNQPDRLLRTRLRKGSRHRPNRDYVFATIER